MAVAVSCWVWPLPTDTLGGVIWMAVRVASVTVTWTALLVMPSLLAVTSVVPATLPVSRPVDETVAMVMSVGSQATLPLISAVVWSL